MPERRHPLQLLTRHRIAALFRPLFPNHPLQSSTLVPRGRSHTNYRVRLAGLDREFLLRAGPQHTLDKEAAICRHVRRTVPVPDVIFVGSGHAVLEWIPATPLDEALAQPALHRPRDLGAAVGEVLAAIAAHRFDAPGDLGPALAITPWPFDPTLAGFLRMCLTEGRAGPRLGEPLTTRLYALAQRLEPLFHNDRAPALVHGDANPTNFLVRRDGPHWRVAAVLDWEWAHSGDPLADWGNLLRHEDTLPPPFVEGLSAAHPGHPPDWRLRALALDLTSQLEFLNSPHDQPQTHAAARHRIAATLNRLGH